MITAGTTLKLMTMPAIAAGDCVTSCWPIDST